MFFRPALSGLFFFCQGAEALGALWSVPATYCRRLPPSACPGPGARPPPTAFPAAVRLLWRRRPPAACPVSAVRLPWCLPASRLSCQCRLPVPGGARLGTGAARVLSVWSRTFGRSVWGLWIRFWRHDRPRNCLAGHRSSGDGGRPRRIRRWPTPSACPRPEVPA